MGAEKTNEKKVLRVLIFLLRGVQIPLTLLINNKLPVNLLNCAFGFSIKTSF